MVIVSCPILSCAIHVWLPKKMTMQKIGNRNRAKGGRKIRLPTCSKIFGYKSKPWHPDDSQSHSQYDWMLIPPNHMVSDNRELEPSLIWINMFSHVIPLLSHEITMFTCILLRGHPHISNIFLSISPLDFPTIIWLVVSIPPKNISQLGWLFPISGKIEVMFQSTNPNKIENHIYLLAMTHITMVYRWYIYILLYIYWEYNYGFHHHPWPSNCCVARRSGTR